MTTIDFPFFTPRPKMLRVLRALAIGGAIGTLLGIYFAPTQTLSGLLLASCYTLGLALGALFIIALDYVTRAGWSTALRRVPESLVATMPLSAALLLVTLLAGLRQLYPWATAPEHGGGGALARWHSPIFFYARSALCLLIWLLFAWAIVHNSRRQDQAGGLLATYRNRRLAATFLPVFAITLSLASFDWLMSLHAHWVSTIFAAYHFAGLFQASIAAVALLVILLRRWGYLEDCLSPSHLHDLGKYLFAFSTFWAYIWFCQYMLIWYSNMPEEASYYVGASTDPVKPLALLSLVLNWVVPFFVLLSANAKRKEPVLLKVCVIVMIGHWIDLYSIVVPTAGMNPHASLWPLVPSIAVAALFLLNYAKALGAGSLVPLRDPMLIESMHHH